VTTLLVIDIGNTNVSLGLFDYPAGSDEHGQLAQHWRTGTHREQTSDEVALMLRSLFEHEGRSCSDVTDVIISSVVPPLLPIWERVSTKLFDRPPLTVGPGIRTGMPVRKVYRKPSSVEVLCANSSSHQFDHVIIATHSDQALSMIDPPTDAEQEILGAMPYQENTVVLHSDRSILPTRKWIWASWNYLIPRETIQRVAVTYNMNILQSIDAPVDFCVSLNKSDTISEDAVIGRYIYSHPIYKTGSPAFKQRHDEISGKNRVHLRSPRVLPLRGFL